MLGFLQTQIGNIITYNNLYQSILQARDKNQTEQVYLLYGRLFYLMIDVQPMVDAPSPLALMLSNALTSRYEKLSA
jgi:hypothetical protein